MSNTNIENIKKYKEEEAILKHNLNDGVCDCTDGSDETYSGKVNCAFSWKYVSNTVVYQIFIECVLITGIVVTVMVPLLLYFRRNNNC